VVTVESNVKAPTGPAYQLALKPRTSQSLIGSVVIVIDASRHLPVAVEVFGRGSAGLVYSVGFTSLSFGAPAASNFSFTPPPGATVKTHVVPGSFPSALLPPGLGRAGAAPKVRGMAAGQLGKPAGVPSFAVPSGKVPLVPIPRQALAAINAKFAASLPASMSKAQRAAAIKEFDKHFKVVSGLRPDNGGGFIGGSTVIGNPVIAHAGSAFGLAGPAPKVIGKDWLSVIATPANPKLASAVQALLSAKGPALAAPANQGVFGSSSSSASSSSAYSSTLTIQDGPNLAVLRALLLATKPVHGSWGSGRLLQTKVVSVLITSKGQILVGAVTPAVLYADVLAAG
jgi:hypothetical protein